MFEHIFEFVTQIINQTGYMGICFFMILESMIFPVPSEAIMPFAGFLGATGRFNPWGIMLASSLGSMIGSWLSYYIGLYGGRAFLGRYGRFFLIDQHHLKLTEDFFARYGEKAVLVSRLIPVIRHLISVPAGTARMDLLKFSFYTLIGATSWNMFLMWCGYILQDRWMIIKKYTHYLDYAVVLALILGIIYLYRKIVTDRSSEVTKH